MKFNFGNFGGFQQDPESGEYSWTPPNRQNSRPKKPRKAMSAGKSAVLSIVITLVFGFLYFYFELPALNIHSGELYIFIILLCLVWCASSLILGGFRASSVKEYVGVARKKAAVPFYIICLCALVAVIGHGLSGRIGVLADIFTALKDAGATITVTLRSGFEFVINGSLNLEGENFTFDDEDTLQSAVNVMVSFYHEEEDSINGGAGVFLRFPFVRERTSYTAPCKSFSMARACSSLFTSSFLPSFPAERRAVNFF